ncbi:MAG: ABC transporter permease [Planctomycetes bacterium]|nr:ABC transporter permease [Planctomycetota bacterium]
MSSQEHPSEPASIAAPAPWLAVWTLSRREIVRFLRQRSRLIGALAQPLVFWVLFGAGLHGSFQAPDWADSSMSYQEYFFPGIAILILMFTAIFASISIIEDRHEGFLQGVLVSPVSRPALVVGKLTGGTILAVGQALLFLGIGFGLSLTGLAPGMTLNVSFLGGVAVFLFLCLQAFSLSAMGFLIAWRLDSVQGFHAIMSVVLMPMWLVSGAFFPGGGSAILDWVIRLNPLTYGVAGLRRLLYSDAVLASEAASPGLPEMTTCLVVSLAFAAVCFWGAVLQTRR